MMQKMKSLFMVFLAIAVVLCFSFVLAHKSIAKADKNQNQNQNQNQNEDEETATGQANAILHRSVVANFVQSLLKVASRSEGGIGEQVRVVAQEQNEAEDGVTEAIKKVEKRSKIKTFLIGSDYKNLGKLRSETVQTRNRLMQLTRLVEKAENEEDKTNLESQIQVMEEEQTRVEDFIQTHENKFSLFGWVRKLFGLLK